jgi:hypothetical protein
MRYVAIVLSLYAVAALPSARAEPAAASDPGQGPALASAAGPQPVALPEHSDAAIERAYRSLELRLERKKDGSFVYTGRGLNARIDTQGGLTLKDKFFKAEFIFEPAQLDEHTWVTHFFRITFDLFARIDKAFGNDPHRSERREFLEQTLELRTLLLERYAEGALERTLEGLWKLAKMSVREKKERLFSLWSECSHDRFGEKARRRIEAFVREHCPPGSACDYSDEELVRLNGSGSAAMQVEARGSAREQNNKARGSERFAPYDTGEHPP